jgi:autoinducer 2-degrading protein
MYVTLVHVHVKPQHLDEFIDSIRANHEASVREPGNIRFDVLQSVEDPTRFILHEWYVDGAGSLKTRRRRCDPKGRPQPARRYGTIENEANPTP